MFDAVGVNNVHGNGMSYLVYPCPRVCVENVLLHYHKLRLEFPNKGQYIPRAVNEHCPGNISFLVMAYLDKYMLGFFVVVVWIPRNYCKKKSKIEIYKSE